MNLLQSNTESTVLYTFLAHAMREADILVKYYKNIAYLSCHDGRIMHRLRCSGIFEKIQISFRGHK